MYPFHSESERNYHAWVGLYIATWAGFEHSLYVLIKTLSVLLKEPELAPNKPLQLSSKLKLLKRIFSTNTLLSHENEEIFAIIKFTEDESIFRHNVIHGVDAEIYKREPWYAQKWRPEQSKKGPESSDLLFVNQHELEEHYNMTGMAGLAIAGLISRLLNLLEVSTKSDLDETKENR